MNKYENIRWLTIKEIAELWAPEIGIPSSVIQRELQLAVINLPRWVGGTQLISEFPSDDTLPSPDQRMDKHEVGLFCEKQGHWPKPNFWFSRSQTSPSYPGRPSVMHAIVQEFERIASSGELKETLAQQSTALAEWARSCDFGVVQAPTATTIGNNI